MSDNVFQFNWRGMTREPSHPYAQPQDGSEQAMAAYTAKQYAERDIIAKIAANEKRIEELKKEYLVLQQEQEAAPEDLERNIAENRAGIGDTSQYNAWRARVDAREASKQAREADSEAMLRQAKSRLNNALIALYYARGDKEEAVTRQVYKDELAAYNELARKLGAPEISESEPPAKKTYTRGDVDRFIFAHRDNNREWDSQENLDMAIDAANTLPDADKTEILKDISGNITQAQGKVNRKKFKIKLEEAVKKLREEEDPGLGENTVKIDGNKYTIEIKAVEKGNKYAAFYGNDMIGLPWEVK